MKKLLVITILFLSIAHLGYSQGGPGFYGQRYEKVGQGDSIMTVYMWKVHVSPNGRAKAQARRIHRSSEAYNKLVYNVRKVYPIAIEGRERLAEVEARLPLIKGEKAKKEYVKMVEKQMKDKYTPVLKNMTFSQGKILIKLIDRETNRTSYQLVKELKNGFSAFLWQNVARVFGANLKQTYDKDGEDQAIEEIIYLYELGFI